MCKYPPPPYRLTTFENFRERLAGPDLARALAITDVVICHDGSLFLDWWHRSLPVHLAYLGFYGVMLFFVLSGFLIGTIMLELLERGTSLRGWGIFLLRRWLRTLPAYYFWLFALLVPLAWFGPYGVPWEEARHVLPFYVTLTQNLGWPMVSGWYGVTWSLCVEEWFYLTFPALLLLLIGCRVRPVMAFGLTLFAFLSVPVFWRLSLPPDVNWNEVTSKIVPCRFDSIGWGIASAWAMRRWPTLSRRSGTLLGMGVFLVLIFWWSDRLPFRIWSDGFQRIGSFDAVAVGYALCLPAMMRLRTLPTFLGRPVRALSTHSYGIYLCHLPLVMMAGDLQSRYGLSREHAVMFTVVTTIGGAILSWRLVERPCLKLRPRQG